MPRLQHESIAISYFWVTETVITIASTALALSAPPSGWCTLLSTVSVPVGAELGQDILRGNLTPAGDPVH